MFIHSSQDAWAKDMEPQDVSGVNLFDMHTIRTATNNFSSSNKLGQGGFGPVYKVMYHSVLFTFSCFPILYFLLL